LKIPLEYVKGLNIMPLIMKIHRDLESKTKVTTEFLLGELAIKYKIIACENK
jgi:hypothetical protein